MSVRLRTQVALVASLDTNEQNVQFQRLNTTNVSAITTFDVEESGQLALAGAEADFALPMGKVATGSFLYIETDGELTIKLDGEAVGHKIKPQAGISGKLLLYTDFTTAPLLTNESATVEANVAFLIAGAKA